MRKTDAFSNTVKSSGFTFGYDGQSLMTASNK